MFSKRIDLIGFALQNLYAKFSEKRKKIYQNPKKIKRNFKKSYHFIFKLALYSDTHFFSNMWLLVNIFIFCIHS